MICGNKLRNVFDGTESDVNVVNDIAQNTCMTAKAVIEIDDYITTINGVDLVLEERPQNIVEVKKEISHVQVNLSDGSKIVDWTPESSGALGDSYVLDTSSTPGLGQILITLDDELRHGATLKVTYKITVKQTSGAENTNYIIYDYLDPGLQFSQEENSGWSIVDLNSVECADYIKTGTKSVVKYEGVKNGDEVELTLTKLLSVNDEGRYENWCEIASYSNTEGRRMYTTTPEGIRISATPANCNSDKTAETDPVLALTQKELDTAEAPTIGITPPFGVSSSNSISGTDNNIEIEKISWKFFKEFIYLMWNNICKMGVL